jgi:hypothetical protein
MATNDLNALLMVPGSGIGAMEAASAVPFAFMTPNSTDPDMTPVKTIVKALQATLNLRSNAGLNIDGVMGPKTATMLKAITPAGVEVGTTRWFELLQFAQRAASSTARPEELSRPRVVPKSGMPAFIPPQVAAGLSNPWVIGGAIALFILLTKKKSRR